MRKILVTGGAGYIGSHTSKLLARSGYEPICFDNLSNGHLDFVKWGEFEFGDVQDTSRLINVFNKYKPEAVIHFAASAYVGESVNNPLKYYYNNVAGTISLIQAMKAVNVKHIVFSSSCATYGVPENTYIDEDTPQIPINPYGESKLMVEKILRDLASKGEISQISLRYFNAAGADRDLEIGEKHEPETHLIPLAIKSALGGDVLNIYGSDFATKDGTAVRDYIHVEDLAKAHLLSLELLLSENNMSQFINLGTGEGYSVKDVVDGLGKLGLDIKYKKVQRREGDPSILVANAERAKKILGWEPEYKNILDILATAVKWHRKNV